MKFKVGEPVELGATGRRYLKKTDSRGHVIATNDIVKAIKVKWEIGVAEAEWWDQKWFVSRPEAKWLDGV